MKNEAIAPAPVGLLCTSLVALLASCGASGITPAGSSPVEDLTPVPTTNVTEAEAAAARDGACPDLLRTLERVERDCPVDAPASPAFESCAARVDRAGQSAKAGYVHEGAALVSDSLRVMLDPELTKSTESLALIAPDAPLVELARRRRAFAQRALRSLCGVDPHREQGNAWTEETEAALLSLQQQQVACVREGDARRTLDEEERRNLHVDVRMFIEPDGRASWVSLLQRLPTMRADIALCVVRTYEKAHFPKPDGRALVRTNVTFARMHNLEDK